MSITPFYQVFTAFGLLVTLYFGIELAQFLILFIQPGSIHRYNRDNNSWALVTGASSGIGFCFAQELCRNGFNVVIHGRDQKKLEAIQAKLNLEFPSCTIRLVVADALCGGYKSIESTLASVQDINLTVLINNLGGISGIVRPQFKSFEKHTAQEIGNIFDLNDRFTVQLTNALLPILKKNQPSLIINIGSLVAAMKMPYLAVYSASKAALTAWSQNLAAEMRLEGEKIEVLAILVGNTQTEGRHEMATSLTVPTARVMAASALQRVGCGKDVVPGYLPHALQRASLRLLPNWVKDIFIGKEATLLKDTDPEKDWSDVA